MKVACFEHRLLLRLRHLATDPGPQQLVLVAPSISVVNTAEKLEPGWIADEISSAWAALMASTGRIPKPE
jgi:hypothetical protein